MFTTKPWRDHSPAQQLAYLAFIGQLFDAPTADRAALFLDEANPPMTSAAGNITAPTGPQRAQLQWVLNGDWCNECGLPVEHCRENHGAS